MNSKSDLRIRAKELRKTLNMPAISSKIVQNIRAHKCYKSSKNIMIFYPTKYEVDLRELLTDKKAFFLPRMNGENLEVCPYSVKDELKKSNFCIMEPLSKAINPNLIDLIIIPALMADKKGYRLGYGCGYYDKFLAKYSIKSICAIPKQLCVEELPRQDFDIPADYVITEIG